MKAHKPVKRKEAFTQEEVKILMEQLPENKVGHTIRLMLATGMRTQEVLALEPQHIEPDGSCIHIRQAVNMVKGRPHIGPAQNRQQRPGRACAAQRAGPAPCSSGNRPGNLCGTVQSPASLSIPATSGINTETPCSAFQASVC